MSLRVTGAALAVGGVPAVPPPLPPTSPNTAAFIAARFVSLPMPMTLHPGKRLPNAISPGAGVYPSAVRSSTPILRQPMESVYHSRSMDGSPTITDVARSAGVSVATASRTLNGARPVGVALRDQVVAAARGLGHTPNPHARALAQAP